MPLPLMSREIVIYARAAYSAALFSHRCRARRSRHLCARHAVGGGGASARAARGNDQPPDWPGAPGAGPAAGRSASGMISLFGPAGLRLADARVRERTGLKVTFTRYEWPGGCLGGAVIGGCLRRSRRARRAGKRPLPPPCGPFRFPLTGCNIRDMKLVTVTNFGVGQVRQAPGANSHSAGAIMSPASLISDEHFSVTRTARALNCTAGPLYLRLAPGG